MLKGHGPDNTHSIHLKEPDYTRPLMSIPARTKQRLFSRLGFLYGEETASAYMPELERILKVYYAHKPMEMIAKESESDTSNRFTEKDIILITYGDLLQNKDRSPLDTLARFCDTYLEGAINTLHILPFFPYSSDRGFSIIDFETVDPRLGSWEDIEGLEGHYQLMFDGVINHISSKNRWFQEFLNGNPLYKDFFIAYDSQDEISPEERKQIFRPRTTDVLTKVPTIDGTRFVWTTFSRDQIDLNYKNPNVLMRVIEILLLYIRHGADIIRLDAVTYLWSEPGTSCAHLGQTHEIIKFFREILNLVAPGVALITETNVPHRENISYFGNGMDEAHMVYNFALPPLVLHTFYTGDTCALSRWAASLHKLSDTSGFFNFLDSHDGIGLMSVKEILTPDEINAIIKTATQHGAYISYKSDKDGIKVPYEINITWFSALNHENDDEDIAFKVKRFVASRAIALVLRGVPGIYLHGLIGTTNDIDAVKATNSKRAINRTVLDNKSIDAALKDPLSKLSHINRELGRLIAIRTQIRAFHPNGAQHILMVSPDIFIVLRSSPENDQHVLCMVNVTSKVCRADIPVEDFITDEDHWFDIVSGGEWIADQGNMHITMMPYDVMWISPWRQTER